MRLHRVGELSTSEVDSAAGYLAATPLDRNPLPGLLAGAWARRENVRITDALYAELAAQLHMRLLTGHSHSGQACGSRKAAGGLAPTPTPCSCCASW